MPNTVYTERLIQFMRYKEGLLLQWRSSIAKDQSPHLEPPQISVSALHICSQKAFVRNHCILQLLSVFSRQQHYRHMACLLSLSLLASWFCRSYICKGAHKHISSIKLKPLRGAGKNIWFCHCNDTCQRLDTLVGKWRASSQSWCLRSRENGQVLQSEWLWQVPNYDG